MAPGLGGSTASTPFPVCAYAAPWILSHARRSKEMCAGQWERFTDCEAEAERLPGRTRTGGAEVGKLWWAAEPGRRCG